MALLKSVNNKICKRRDIKYKSECCAENLFSNAKSEKMNPCWIRKQNKTKNNKGSENG